VRLRRTLALWTEASTSRECEKQAHVHSSKTRRRRRLSINFFNMDTKLNENKYEDGWTAFTAHACNVETPAMHKRTSALPREKSHH